MEREVCDICEVSSIDGVACKGALMRAVLGGRLKERLWRVTLVDEHCGVKVHIH